MRRRTDGISRVLGAMGGIRHVLVVCNSWKEKRWETKTALRFRGGAKGVSKGVPGRRAKSRSINKIVAESMSSRRQRMNSRQRTSGLKTTLW